MQICWKRRKLFRCRNVSNWRKPCGKESITSEGYEPLVTPAQADELDRRLEEHRRDPKSGIPWEQVKVELDQKYGRSK